MELSPPCGFKDTSLEKTAALSDPRVNSAALSITRANQLFARMGVGFLDLIYNPRKVIGFGSLQRRILFVRQQVPQPQLLADGQHVPVVLERSHWTAKCPTKTHGRL